MPARPAVLGIRKAPRQRRAAHTVGAILEAAALVLETDGLEGFNTNAVARRAGASIGTLYQYFPSKDALTLALLQREEGKYREAATAAAVPGHAAGRRRAGADAGLAVTRGRVQPLAA